jgi:hypothetical protein
MPKVAAKQGLSPPDAGGILSWLGNGAWRTLRPSNSANSDRHAGVAEVLIAIVLFLQLFLPSTLPAQDSSKTYETRYAVISYSEIKDLHTFTRNIGSGMSSLWESPQKNPLLAKTQVDKIVELICSLLDMYPPNLRFGITLYRTQAEVTAAYRKAQGSGAAPVAFYFHRTRSIAVAIDSITDNILAHEIAHAVICAYFVIPPPARMQEILAQYSDKNFSNR